MCFNIYLNIVHLYIGCRCVKIKRHAFISKCLNNVCYTFPLYLNLSLEVSGICRSIIVCLRADRWGWLSVSHCHTDANGWTGIRFSQRSMYIYILFSLCFILLNCNLTTHQTLKNDVSTTNMTILCFDIWGCLHVLWARWIYGHSHRSLNLV